METFNNRKNADYNGAQITSNSKNNLFNLREFGIKKEYLVELVLPFAKKLMDENTDISKGDQNLEKTILVKDNSKFSYMISLVAMASPNGLILLYDSNNIGKIKRFIGTYTMHFDQDSNIIGATEDREIGDKHINVYYETGFSKNGEAEAKVKTVLISGIKGKTDSKFFVGKEVRAEDIVEEIKQPADFALVTQLPVDLRE